MNNDIKECFKILALDIKRLQADLKLHIQDKHIHNVEPESFDDEMGN